MPQTPLFPGCMPPVVCAGGGIILLFNNYEVRQRSARTGESLPVVQESIENSAVFCHLHQKQKLKVFFRYTLLIIY